MCTWYWVVLDLTELRFHYIEWIHIHSNLSFLFLTRFIFHSFYIKLFKCWMLMFQGYDPWSILKKSEKNTQKLFIENKYWYKISTFWQFIYYKKLIYYTHNNVSINLSILSLVHLTQLTWERFQSQNVSSSWYFPLKWHHDLIFYCNVFRL